jgi:type I restriction enzyme S subunit
MPFTEKEFAVYSLQPGDILLNEGQSLELVGRSAIFTGPEKHFCFQNTLIRFRPSDSIASEFAQHVFQHYLITRVFASVASRTTSIAHLGVERFASLHIAVPPKEEQLAITRVLSSWDRGIRQLTDLIAAKVRFKQGLMQQLLTGQRRFPGFKEDWKHVRIGGVAREISERNPDGDSIPVLSCTKYDGLVDSLEYFGKRVFSENTDNYKVVRRNDFAYATNHIEEGSIGLLKHADAGLVSPMYTVFRTNGGVNPDYLYRVLKTETLRQVFASFTSASVNRRGSLRWKQFSTIPLELPSVDEQSLINKAMAAFDREIELLRKQLEALKQQKKGLMQKLLTGEVRVKLPKGVA